MSKKNRQKTSAAALLKTLDLSKYEAPIAGFANGCAAIESEDVVEFVFFEVRPGIPPVTVGRFFITYMELGQVWMNTQEFYGKMETMIDRHLWGKNAVMSATPKDLPNPTAPAPLCSIVGMAKFGLAGLIECFYLPASSMLRVSQGARQVKVVPLFGVQMPAGLLWSMIEKIKAIVSAHSQPVSQT
ncbi:MAG: hypothetical protein M3Z54_07635 [Gemmatimonadota bacterium]|nr:hypothetical protein [Gemmatimonadota bacterium]